jgi:hypothetical protein
MSNETSMSIEQAKRIVEDTMIVELIRAKILNIAVSAAAVSSKINNGNGITTPNQDEEHHKEFVEELEAALNPYIDDMIDAAVGILGAWHDKYPDVFRFCETRDELHEHVRESNRKAEAKKMLSMLAGL